MVPTTLGSDDPMWILCAITFRSSELPVVGSACLRLMAEDTHLHTVGIAAVESQLVVTGVAALGADDIARDGNRRAVRHEVEGGPGVTDSQVERREIAVAVNGDGGGRRGIKSRRSLSDERVLVLAWRLSALSCPQIRSSDGQWCPGLCR